MKSVLLCCFGALAVVGATRYRCGVLFKFDDVPDDRTPLIIYSTWRDTWAAAEGDRQHLTEAFPADLADVWLEMDHEPGQAAAARVVDGDLAISPPEDLVDDYPSFPDPNLDLAPIQPVDKMVPPEEQIDMVILFLAKELLRIYQDQMTQDCTACELVLCLEYHDPKKCCCGENREVLMTVQAIENTQRYLASIIYDFVFGNQFEAFLGSVCQQLNSAFSMSIRLHRYWSNYQEIAGNFVSNWFDQVLHRFVDLIRHSMG